MKRILCILLLVGSVISAAAQHAQLDDFMSHLATRGAKVAVARINDQHHLSRRYNVTFEDDSLLADTICVFLDRLARHAVESYRYESHRNGRDTITYSIALRGYGSQDDYLLDLERAGDPDSSWTSDYTNYRQTHSYLYPNPYMKQQQRFYELLGGNNRRMFLVAREAVMFDYVLGHGNLIAMQTQRNEAVGTYYHFDISPVDSLLTRLLPRGTSRQVHYQHAAGDPVAKSTTYYSTDYLLPRTRGKSESHGTLYVVPPAQGAAALYRQLLAAAQHHLDANPTQCCVLEYTDHHFKLSGVRNTVKLRVNDIALSSFLMADLDRSGTLYVLRLEVDGEYWIPRDWKQGF